MSTMYSRSAVMMSQAQNALGKVSEDEAYLDIACFETQQALEFLIKTILQENGTAFPKTHDIRFLLELLAETGLEFDRKDELEMLADTVTDWEENSRYGKGVRTSVQTIKRVHNIYYSLNRAFIESQAENNE